MQLDCFLDPRRGVRNTICVALFQEQLGVVSIADEDDHQRRAAACRTGARALTSQLEAAWAAHFEIAHGAIGTSASR